MCVCARARACVFARVTRQLCGKAEHVRRMKASDLFLDSFPYGAHTTCSEALYAGLPVLTRPGLTFASRVAASLLHALFASSSSTDTAMAGAGVRRARAAPATIVFTEEDFVAVGARIGQRRAAGRRAALRERSRAAVGSSPMFSAGLWARHWTRLLTSMWEVYVVEGRDPASAHERPIVTSFRPLEGIAHARTRGEGGEGEEDRGKVKGSVVGGREPEAVAAVAESIRAGAGGGLNAREEERDRKTDKATQRETEREADRQRGTEVHGARDAREEEISWVEKAYAHRQEALYQEARCGVRSSSCSPPTHPHNHTLRKPGLRTRWPARSCACMLPLLLYGTQPRARARTHYRTLTPLFLIGSCRSKKEAVDRELHAALKALDRWRRNAVDTVLAATTSSE